MSIPPNRVDKAFVNHKIYKPLPFFDYYYKSFYYIPLLFGYNFLPSLTPKRRFVLFIFLIYALFLSLGSSLYIIIFIKNLHLSPYVFISVEYVAAVSLLLITNGKCKAREEFFKNIKKIDEQLHVSTSYYSKLRTVTLISVLFVLCTRVLYSTALCYSFEKYCSEAPFMIVICGFVLIAVDTNQMPRLIVFQVINYRMRLLRKRVEKLFKNDTLPVIGSKNKINTLILYQETYGSILDSVNMISTLVNPLFLLSLLCSFPKIMILIYNIIVLHKRGVPLFHLLVLGLEALQWGVVSCLPGIVFEITRAQVDQMKMFLLQQYKYCNDEMIRLEIKEFLNYIELRPCQYYLYRLIPVDVTLPVGLLHLCTTYLIVMIQFSHLFEDVNVNN